MSRRAVPEEGNVTRLLPPAREETMAEVSTPRAEALRYIQNMTLELERLANTLDLELVGYFLLMARNEAEHAAKEPPPGGIRASLQAPYRSE
jgi:hypothetical protein